MRRELPISRLSSLPGTNAGLSGADIAERRKRYGRNDILEVASKPWLDLARETLRVRR